MNNRRFIQYHFLKKIVRYCKYKQHAKSGAGFTLIEMLVVISIIGFLGSVTLVNVNSAREKARIAAALSWEATTHHSIGAYLVGEYLFNKYDPSNIVVFDTSGYDNDGRLDSDPSGSKPTEVAPENCVRGGCYLFSSYQCEYIEVEGGTPITDYPFSISAWFISWGKSTGQVCGGQYSTYQEEQVIVNLADPLESDRHYGIYIGREDYDPNDLTKEIRTVIIRVNKGGTQRNNFGRTIVTDGRWHQVVAAFNDYNDRRLYLDGQQVEFMPGQTIEDAPFMKGTTSWAIGRWADATPGSYFNGMIDEVRIFDEALNRMIIRNMYEEGLQKHQNLVLQSTP